MTSRRLNIINKLKARFPKKTITFNDHTIPDWFNSEGLPLSVKGPNNRYLVPWDEGVCNKTFWQFLQWRKERFLNNNNTELDNSAAFMPNVYDPVRAGSLTPTTNSNPVKLTWIGHSTTLVQMGNFTILTDPVLSARCSPSQLVGTHRYVDAAVSVDDLPKDINIVLISHDHYDHLDIDTITALGVDRPQIQYYVPMGTKDLLVNSCGIKENYVREMVWWQETKFESADTNAKIVCTPAQHWCSRTPFDRNKRLWCSWVVHTGNENESEKESENGRFFFGGDTGRPKHFPLYSLIGQKYGPFHLSALPVGAYSPTWFMSPAHCGPDEAIQIHQDLKSEQSVGIHWGTFPLADEPYFEPAQLLKKFCLEAGISFEKEFVLLRHGETLLSGEDNKTSEKLKTLLDCEL